MGHEGRHLAVCEIILDLYVDESHDALVFFFGSWQRAESKNVIIDRRRGGKQQGASKNREGDGSPVGRQRAGSETTAAMESEGSVGRQHAAAVSE